MGWDGMEMALTKYKSSFVVYKIKLSLEAH
jgi:hypothetical protein